MKSTEAQEQSFYDDCNVEMVTKFPELFLVEARISLSKLIGIKLSEYVSLNFNLNFEAGYIKQTFEAASGVI